MILWSRFRHLGQGLGVRMGAGALLLVGVVAVAGVEVVRSVLVPWAC